MKIEEYLRKAVADEASDLFIGAGACVSEKVGLDVEPMDEKKLTPTETEALVLELYELAGRNPVERDDGDDDFSFAIHGLARFRVNVYRQRGTWAAVLRAVAFSIPDPAVLGIPDAVMSLADVKSGMVIVTGSAGSGKSTTQACIVDRINHTKKRHIVTLEDPIEYLHRNDKSIVSQREIELDSASYATALRSCLRQAPDVIFLGEMRDPETIKTAMTAAETGHLVLGTLHTKGAANTVNRIIDAFPPDQQHQIQVQLAMVLDTVVFQEMIPTRPHPSVAFEIMKMMPGVRAMIRDGKVHQLDAAIAQGSRDGMVSMDRALADLLKAKRVQFADIERLASDPAQVKRLAGM